MKSKAFLTALLLISSTLVFAAGGGGHHDEHIPLDKIGWQAANLGFLLVVIFFAIRKSVVQTFVNRRAQYLEQSEKTQSALKEAEKALVNVKDKLANLESGEKKSVERAHHEANLLKTNIIKDAEQSAEKLKKDVEMLIAAEVIKAKTQINESILSFALDGSKKSITTGASDSSKQEAAFINQISKHSSQVTT